MIVEAMTRYPEVIEDVLIAAAFLSAQSRLCFPGTGNGSPKGPSWVSGP
jgi:hypothetical protein